MTPDKILDQSKFLIGGPRRAAYGPPDKNFPRVATMWGAFIGHPLTAAQVAWMLCLLKVARASEGVPSDDTATDAAAYAALAGSLNPEDSTAHEENIMSGWQPIETAPKDGMQLIVWNGEFLSVSSWGKTAHVPFYGFLQLVGCDFQEMDLMSPQPTHWLPFPEAPHD